MERMSRRSQSVFASSLVVVSVAVSGACGGDGGDGGGPGGGSGDVGRAGLFGPDVVSLELEVDYQVGAEPYDDYAIRTGSPWALLDDNLRALFDQASTREIIVPMSLDEMQALDDVAGEDFRGEDLLAIAESHRDVRSTETERSLYIVFVDGYYDDGSGRQEQVLGVSLGDTGVIGIFKPVIGTGVVAPFVEQTTLIHEVGHAVGLVNNGLAMASDHHDEDHGAHCSNEDCVMYYLNEGASDAIDFARERLMGGDTVVLGAECLADADAAAASGD